ncbi:MAG: DUF4097 family beta strand repeat-containing protein [Acidobacteriia bacterium]|nr:DUF4097 family beta strand repeat-containing protein [Terriglobia bacterium]
MSFKSSLRIAPIVRRLLLIALAVSMVTALGDFSPVALAAGDRFEKRFPTGSSPQVILTNDNGFVVVRGVPRNEVHVVATKRSTGVEIDTESVGNRVRFDTHWLDPNMKPFERTVDYVLEVPERAAVEIHNVTGRVKVEDVKGNVNVDALNSSMELSGVAGSMILRSVSGSMTVSNSSGRIEANSISGDIQFNNLQSQSIDASTASGNISYIGPFFDNGKYALSNYSGAIDVVTPEDSSFELDARSVKGSVQSEIPLKSKPHYNLNPTNLKQSLLGIYNDGAASVHLSSFSGRIRIRKK